MTSPTTPIQFLVLLASLISSTAASNLDLVRATNETKCPLATSLCANALPNPSEPPVMMTWQPFDLGSQLRPPMNEQ